jgi:hypothetical protein
MEHQLMQQDQIKKQDAIEMNRVQIELIHSYSNETPHLISAITQITNNVFSRGGLIFSHASFPLKSSIN